MSVITKSYRQTTYGDRYTIEYRRKWLGDYEIWCVAHPHNPYDTGVDKCHLFSSGKVCVASGNEPSTLDRAKAIATFWMDGYSRYIRTGEFYNGPVKINV